MILQPQLYDTDMEDSSDRPRLSGSDLLRLETASDHAQAHIIAKRIMRHFKLTPQKVYAELDVGGVDWAKAGDNTVDLSPLFV
jgi:hypothetical protein